MPTTIPTLPAPKHRRWKPLRCGLIELFKYDDQQFFFEDGHLLLRGDNGTGKSRVLALSLPFLLDGRIDPTRVEPDQDRAKSMAWNLLMGEHQERTGYTWLEFGRLDEHDAAIYCTIGCGLRAIKGRSGVETWFFVTNQRVGTHDEQLSLVEKRRVVKKPALIEAIGGHGEVFTAARDYRQAVDRTLFQLGPRRYKALIDLLIQLRQPQLSRSLDEALLNRVLSDALPPMPEELLASVASAFSTLDEDKHQLEALSSAETGARHFVEVYRRYAQTEATITATPVRKAHSKYEDALRTANQTRAKAEAAETALQKAKTQHDTLHTEQQRLAATIDTLKASPEMRTAQALQKAASDAEAAQKEAQYADQTRHRAKRFAQQQEQLKEQAQARAESREQEHGTARENAQRTADAAALSARHTDLQTALDKVSPKDAPATQRRFQAFFDLVKQQARAAQQLQQHRDACKHSQEQAQKSAREADQQSRRLQNVQDDHRAMGQKIEAEGDTYIESASTWQRSLKILILNNTQAIEDALPVWCRHDPHTGDPPSNPLTVARDEALRGGQTQLANRKAQTENDRSQVDEDINESQRILKELEAGVHQPPPPSPTRDATARAERAGAPLWQLIDFSQSLNAAQQAGLEAALEALGFLDAWLTPDGRLLDTDLDAFLIPGPERLDSTKDGLNHLLQPAKQLPESMPRNIVQRVLSMVNTTTETDSSDNNPGVWVNVDGHYGAGPLRGRYQKPAAQHIGHAARETRRQQQIADTQARLADLAQERTKFDDELKAIAAQREQLEAEAQAPPSDEPLRNRWRELVMLSKRVDRERSELAQLNQRRVEQEAAAQAAQQALVDEANALGLSDFIDRPSDLRDKVRDYENALRQARSAFRDAHEAIETAAQAAQTAATAHQEAERAAKQSRRRQDHAAACSAAHQALEQTSGKGVREVQAKLQAAQTSHQDNQTKLEESSKQINKAIAVQAAAEEKRKQAAKQRDESEETRNQEIESLQYFIREGFLRAADPALDADVADPQKPWSPTRGVEVARQIKNAFGEVAPDSERRQAEHDQLRESFSQLQTTLDPHGYATAMDHLVGSSLFRVTVRYRQQPEPVDTVASELAREVSDRQQILDAKEKQIIEDHLIDQSAVQLHELIHEAGTLVAAMTSELAGKTTATGMELRFKWGPDDTDDDTVRAALPLLRTNPGGHGPDQRRQLAEFLQHAIRRVRENDPTLGWHEVLSLALDHRTWHRFTVERRAAPGDPWKPLTRKTHGTGSGGEKALALTVPQFAAASAHYLSADEHAPRLIMLDEAFAGVDLGNRARCMQILQSFDLDFVMTSDNDQGCYADLAGNAIYHLSTRPGVDAVLCTPYVWNGTQRTRPPEHGPAHRPPQPEAETNGLLGTDQA